MKEKVNCKLCGKNKTKLLFKKEGYNFVKCQNCGLIYVNPRDSDETAAKRYQEPYFHIKDFQKKDPDIIGYFDYIQDRPIYEEYFEEKIKQIEKIKPAPGKILDIGCSLGYFLNRAKEHGFRTYGVEISKFAADYARKNFGHQIISGELKSDSFPKNYFDVITLFQTIEHFPDPLFGMKIIYSFLKKDGLIVITTPNASSLIAKLMGKKWFCYRPKEHLYNFTDETIKKLLEKSGFRNIIIKSDNYAAHPLERIFERISYHYRSRYILSIINLIDKILKTLRLSQLKIKLPVHDTIVFASK